MSSERRVVEEAHVIGTDGFDGEDLCNALRRRNDIEFAEAFLAYFESSEFQILRDTLTLPVPLRPLR